MAKGKAKKRSVNYDILKIIRNYHEPSAVKERRFDMGIPFIIASLSIFTLIYFDRNLLEILKELNNVSVTVMSILAGFNTASIAIISSSNPLNFVESIEQDVHTKGRQLLNGLTTYFSYAIILQLFILIVSIVSSVLLKFISYESITNNCFVFSLFALIFLFWFTLILNSLFITLRNASILHAFILYLSNKE